MPPARPARSPRRWLAVLAVLLGLFLVFQVLTHLTFPRPLDAPRKVTRTVEAGIRRAAMLWRGMHTGDACPTVEQLRAEKLIDPVVRVADAWGTPFEIECSADETTIRSLGPDRKRSADDVLVPAPPPDH